MKYRQRDSYIYFYKDHDDGHWQVQQRISACMPETECRLAPVNVWEEAAMLLPMEAPKLRLGMMEPAMLADRLARIRAALDCRAASLRRNAGLSMDFWCS